MAGEEGNNYVCLSEFQIGLSVILPRYVYSWMQVLSMLLKTSQFWWYEQV